ncbi:N-acetylmuramoyl-L-alanine amidase [Williamsia sp. CHRR-6]|uniref:N-acetylmuramoyl-L-alanine amidase n=1 Tax=Williamsia sp. CHRR-6 TaxID=2835871 RepID=UPI001BDB1A73|nr:N-acetylmuramoyl-L-alanine amidase [Williamsia sp. CHRR-6]MBT0565576.1 N-acetylmuramoyl-L-alanine amidase [Williamsia sp. CHRR-6]
MTRRPFRTTRIAPALGALTSALLMLGAVSSPAAAVPAPPAPAAPAPAPSVSTPSATTPSATTPIRNALVGKTVFLDPGHQASAVGHSLTRQVPDGRGGMKDCQTSGATGVNGATEHTVNWDVVQLIKAGLQSQGATVVLSRPDDVGWGGCVDERAAAANAAKADLAVSIHADSTALTADPGKKGFHIIVPQLPVPDPTVSAVQGTTGRAAATQMRDSFKAAGFPTANYAGVVDGLQTRSDVAAVNLTKVPAVFIEMGNLANPTEAAQLASPTGQAKYAGAVLDGIVKFLLTGPGAAPAATPSLPQGSQNAATANQGEVPNAASPTARAGVDLTGLGSLIPLISKLIATKDPADIQALLAGQGSDVSAQVLKSVLSVIYAMFGGKLPF